MAGVSEYVTKPASGDPFKLLVQSIVDYAIYMLDPNGFVTSWNAGAERIKGFQAEEVIGKHFSTFYTEEDREGGLPAKVLETAARTDARSGWTDLYVTPPYRFRAVEALVTNFHLPRSSLLLLVTAFVQAGMPGAMPYEARDRLLDAYREALAEGYRFFSFGDAMLIV